MTHSQTTPYIALGGADGLRRLVDRFYALMDALPEAYGVRKLHPPSLDDSALKLFEFLSGWLGGPSLYIEKRGHPRLRMRHLPYTIGAQERDEWMLCMRMALAEQVEDPELRAGLEQVFMQMADHMVNAAPGS
jgi:hemoglobin